MRALQAVIDGAVRSAAYRIGRRIYFWARGETANDPTRNGEYWLLEQVLGARAGSSPLLVDIGANRGDWSAAAVEIAGTLHVAPKIAAFEPCSRTRELLTRRLAGRAEVEIGSQAFSNQEGEAQLWSEEGHGGTNSLHPVSGELAERVELLRFDTWLEARGVSDVALVKIDTEGYDALVLEGAAGSLKEGRIEVLQFEYNWRWLLNGRSLRDVYGRMAEWPYRLARLAPKELQFLPDWHPELDRFFEGNYVLIRSGSPLERLGRQYAFDRFNALVPVSRADVRAP